MHFLRKTEIYGQEAARLVPQQPWTGCACVAVKFIGRDRLELQSGSIRLLKGDAKMAPLPPRIAVVDSSGKPIKPSPGRSFYVTVETFDPFHMLTEIESRS